MKTTPMFQSSLPHLPLFTILVAASACGSAPSDDTFANGETSESAQTSCDTGIVLPDLFVEGYVSETPALASSTKSVGIVLGTLDERAPTSIDPPSMISYDPLTGLKIKGYTFAAKRGERFSVGSFTSQRMSYHVYGPIDACEAPATDPPATFEGIDGWRAPADGTYFVASSHTVYRDTGGTLSLNPYPKPSYPGLLAIRRLRVDDTPVGHAFVESSPLPMYNVTDASVQRLAGEDKPVLLLLGKKLPETNGGPAQVPSLVVVRQGAKPLYVAQCAEGLRDIVAGDFNGDGRTDVLSGRNLFKGTDGGGFACEPSGFVTYGDRVMGPVDIDHDGANDVLVVGFGGVAEGTTTSVWATPHFHRGTTFVSGAPREIDLPLQRTFEPTRATFLDVTGDGQKEIVVAMIDPTSTATSADDKLKVMAFSVPTYSPEDATPPSFDSPALPLKQALMLPELTPPALEIGNRGARLFDADGDGVRDRILPRTTYSYSGFGLAYGAPAPEGAFHLPWDVPSEENLGNGKIVEHLDYDGDGCEDVILANYGMRLFRGVRCIVH